MSAIKLKPNIQFSLISILMTIWIITCSLISFLILTQSNLFKNYNQPNPVWNVDTMVSFVGINIGMCVFAVIFFIIYLVGGQQSYCFVICEVLIATTMFITGVVISSIWAKESNKIMVDGGVIVSLVYGFLASFSWAVILFRGCTLTVLLTKHARASYMKAENENLSPSQLSVQTEQTEQSEHSKQTEQPYQSDQKDQDYW